MLLLQCTFVSDCYVDTNRANDKNHSCSMDLRHTCGAEISLPCPPLHFHGGFAMEDSFLPPHGTTLRRHFPPPRAERPLSSSLTLNPGDEAQHCSTAMTAVPPRTPSPRPYLPAAAPQPALHNAQPSPDRRTRAVFPRRRAPPPVSPRHGARCFAVLAGSWTVLRRAPDATRATVLAGTSRSHGTLRQARPSTSRSPARFPTR